MCRLVIGFLFWNTKRRERARKSFLGCAGLVLCPLLNRASSVARALIGGALIGLASVILWVANGRIAGISSIIGGGLGARGRELGWRVAFTIGLIAALVYAFYFQRIRADILPLYQALEIPPHDE